VEKRRKSEGISVDAVAQIKMQPKQCSQQDNGMGIGDQPQRVGQREIERVSERGEGKSGGNCTPQCSQTINENGQQSCHQNAWKTGKSGAQMLEMEMET